jgi:hypothetical protein
MNMGENFYGVTCKEICNSRVAYNMDETPIKIRQFTYHIVYDVLLVIEVILLLDFLFKLLGADPSHTVVKLLYAISSVFVAPFNGIFRTSMVNNMVFDPSLLVAMISYSLIAYIIVWIVKLMD